MKKYFILFIFMVPSIIVLGQTWSFSGRIGYGTYSMNGLKDLQKFRLQQTDLPLKTTDNYPETPFYRAEIAINDLKFIDKIGAFYTFNSTGARSTLSDYSGRIDFDALINAHQLGLSVQNAFTKGNNYSLGMYGDVSWLKTILSIKDRIELVDPLYTEQEKFDFNANSFAVEPGFYAEYIVGQFHFQINFGYLVHSGTKLFLEDSKEQWLQANNKDIKPEWDGLRMGIQTSFFFGKKTNDGKKQKLKIE